MNILILICVIYVNAFRYAVSWMVRHAETTLGFDVEQFLSGTLLSSPQSCCCGTWIPWDVLHDHLNIWLLDPLIICFVAEGRR